MAVPPRGPANVQGIEFEGVSEVDLACVCLGLCGRQQRPTPLTDPLLDFGKYLLAEITYFHS